MFCKKCGAELQSGVKFCANCGSAVEEVNIENNNVVSQESTVVQPTVENSSIAVEQSSNSGVVSNTTNEPVVQQPVPPVQPTYQVPMQPSMQPANKKKDYVFIIAIVVIGLALIAIPIILNMGKDKKENNSNSNSNSYSNTNSNSGYNTNTNSNSGGYNSNSNTNSGSNSNSNSNSTTGKQVTLGNYTFTLPANAEVEIDDGDVTFDHLRNANDFGYLTVQIGNYDQIKTSKEVLQQYLQASTDEFVVGNMSVSSYNGVEFVVLTLSQDGLNMVCGFTKLSNTEFAMVMVMNTNYTADYTLLNEMATIIKTAKRTGASGM